MTNVLLVGAGGFLGASFRYLLSGWIVGASGTAFPAATLIVNVLGCLAIGLLGGLAEARDLLSPGARLFLVVGMLGGFTTYSTFAYEALQLARLGELARFAAYTLLHLVLGFAAAAGGFRLGRGS